MFEKVIIFRKKIAEKFCFDKLCAIIIVIIDTAEYRVC